MQAADIVLFLSRSGSSPNLTDHQGTPMSKMAELKKIKTWTTSDRPVLGTDITAMKVSDGEGGAD